MKSSRKYVVLLVESSRTFGRQLVKGVVEYANLRASWEIRREPAGLEEMNSYKNRAPMDGIIAHVRNVKPAKRFIPKDKPAVVKGIGELVPGVCNIVGDTEAVGRMAAEHLRERGFKSFAYCGYREILWSREFGSSFCNALEGHGLPASLYFQSEARVKRLWREQIMQLARWLGRLPKPIGIMACNDDHGQVESRCGAVA